MICDFDNDFVSSDLCMHVYKIHVFEILLSEIARLLGNLGVTLIWWLGNVKNCTFSKQIG